MTVNPLVAPVVDTTTPFQGAFLLESGEALVSAIQNESWLEGGMAAFSLALDTVATAMDPLGSLIAAGLGWVMEHLQPLKGWLDDLTGDADEVASFAATWGNVSTSLAGSAAELRRVLSDLDACDGATIEAYRRFQQDAADHVAAAGDWASAMSTGMQVASVIVQIVHDLVRDAIAQVVGSVISYAAELALTLGAAAPYVAAQAASKVASLSARLMTTMTRLVRSIGSLRGIVDELGTLFRRFGDLVGPLLRTLRNLDLPGFGRSGTDAPSTPRPPDGTPPRTPGDGTPPAGPAGGGVPGGGAPGGGGPGGGGTPGGGGAPPPVPPRSPEVDLEVPTASPPRTPDGPDGPRPVDGDAPGTRPDGDDGTPDRPGDGTGTGGTDGDAPDAPDGDGTGTDPTDGTPRDPLQHKPEGVSDERYLELRELSVHNPDADRYMLGKFNAEGRSYIEEAGGTTGGHHVVFSLGDDDVGVANGWEAVKNQQGLDDDGMFEAYNRPFLDEAIASGKPIDFSHDPRKYLDSALGREFEILSGPPNNYRIVPNGGLWTMLPPGAAP